jgi:4-amino-4-deoxychorismate lyase
VTTAALAVVGRGLVALDEPVIRADDLAVQRGEGVFETARVCAGRPVLLEAHLDRMRLGAARLAITLPSDDAWRAAADTALAASGAGDGLLKLLCTRGPEDGEPVAFALVLPQAERLARQREHGVRAVTLTLGLTAEAAATAPWLLRGVKSTSYAVNMASMRAAEAQGAEDAIWISADGFVLEAPTSNVVWVAGEVAVTPPAEGGLLRGVTLEALRAGAAEVGVRLEVRPGSVDELRSAAELMLTSSVRGVAPVLALDGVAVGDGTVGPVTRALRAAYEALCHLPNG